MIGGSRPPPPYSLPPFFLGVALRGEWAGVEAVARRVTRQGRGRCWSGAAPATSPQVVLPGGPDHLMALLV